MLVTAPSSHLLATTVRGNLSIATVEQNTRATRHDPATGRGQVEFDILIQDDLLLINQGTNL